MVTETYRYEGLGGRLSEKRVRGTDPAGAGAASFSQSYTFDALGNVLEETYPHCISPRCERYGPPRVVTYEYAEGSLTGIPGWLDSLSYHSNGLLSQMEHVNGMTDSWSKDPDSMQRPREIDFDGTTSMSLGTYSYDGAGNVKSIGSHLFAYDLVSRLTEADLQPLGQSQSYSFDSYGNMTSIVTTSGGVPESRPIGVSAATNRLTGAGYDPSGNVTSLFTLSSLTYDPFNRVTHLTGTGVNKSFLYDTSDNRVAILDHQAQTEEWHLRGLHDKVVRSFELGAEGWSWKKDWIFRDGHLVGSSAPAQWREYHLDHLGSPRLVTGPIGFGVAEYHPFPFGEMASANEPGLAGKERRLFRYTGHERDLNCEGCAIEGEDDLDYMMARMYSPVVGRFLAVDPLGGILGAPQTWNRHVYTINNPLLYIDPAGLNPECSTVRLDDGSDQVICSDRIEVTAPDPQVTPWQLGWEWLIGIGPRDRVFTDGDRFTELLRQHEHIQNVLNQVCTGLRKGPGDAPYSLAGLQGVPKYLRDYSTLTTGGLTGNLATTFLGSYDLRYSYSSGIVSMTVTNTSTAASGLRPPVIGYEPWWNQHIGSRINQLFSSGPMSQTTQTIHFSSPCP